MIVKKLWLFIKLLFTKIDSINLTWHIKLNSKNKVIDATLGIKKKT